jgi:acylphosphatase
MKINGDGGWVSLGGQWSSIPIVGRNQDGRLEIFIVGQSEKLYHRYQTSPNNSNGWNDKWEDLGGKWNRFNFPSIGQNADGRLEIFIVGQSEKLYHRYQTSPNNSNGWNDKWEDLGGKWNANPVVANNADGRLEIFIVGKSEKLYHTWQISPSNGWNDKWEDLGGKWNANPVVANNADGRLEIFIVGQSEKLYHTWQISPSNGWI